MAYPENESTTMLTTLLVNAEAIVSTYFDMFFNPNPIDVTLNQYDSDGVIKTYTVPNMAKYKLIFTRGYVNPEGNVESKAGGVYLDIITMTPYVKTSEDSSAGGGTLGWTQLLTPRELLAHDTDPEAHLEWLARIHGSVNEYFNVAPAFADTHAVQRVYIGLLESLKTPNKSNIVSAINNLQDQVDTIVQSSDVFDIVGTYTDLENYDTDTVPPNDIIKVLRDATHNDAITYYRCIKTPDPEVPDPHNPEDYIFVRWDYIGEEGPYYTKTESDNRFIHLCKETPIEYPTETIRGVKIFNNDNNATLDGCTTFYRDVNNDASYIKFTNKNKPTLGYLGVDNYDHPIYVQSSGSNWNRIVRMPTNQTTSVGSQYLPVYIDTDGIATECGFTVQTSVPANAVFTDTKYTAGTGLGLLDNEFKVVQADTVTKNFTNIGSGSIDGNYNYTGASNSYLLLPNVIQLNTANSWEFQTTYKYNGGGSKPTIIGYYNSLDCKTPAIFYDGNAGIRLLASTNGSSWDILTNGFTPVTNTIYNIKAGFTGSEYYLEYKTENETSWTRLSVQNSTKCYCNEKFILMNLGWNYSSYYSAGTMDLKATKIIVNGSVVWKAVTTTSSSGFVAKATNSLYGLVKPDNASITVNDGVISSHITSSDVTTALGYTPYNSTNPAGYTSNVGTVTSVNNIQPINGNVTLPSAEYTAGTGIDITNSAISIKQGGNSIYRFDGTYKSTQIYNVTWNFNIEDTVEFMFKYNITDYNASNGRAIFEASNSSTSQNRSRLSIYVSNNDAQSSYGQSGIRFRYLDADGDSYSSTIIGANFITGDYFNRDLYLKILKRYDVSTSKIGVIISLSTDGINWNNSKEVMSTSTALGSLIFTTLKIGESNYTFNGWQNPSYMRGTIDFSPSYIKVNDAYFWQGSNYVSAGVATATPLLYGLVKPDNTSITVNDGVISSHITSSDVTTALGYNPQAQLVSGTNIKTINNNSILGSGNLTLDGLPSQTGQSGKFLTTDGTDASWATVTIPTPTYDSTNERITW